MVYKQIVHLPEPDPQAGREVLGTIATVFALARQGKVDKRGLPKNPLRMAITLRTLAKYGGYDASVPVIVQRVTSATMGKVAEWLGYQASDPAILFE